jgi:large conductance mechanosensitive channel
MWQRVGGRRYHHGAAFGQVGEGVGPVSACHLIRRRAGLVYFSLLFLNLSRKEYDSIAAAKAAGAATLNYGLFLNTIVNFLIIAFAVFLLLRQVNWFMPKPAPAPGPVAMRDLLPVLP